MKRLSHRWFLLGIARGPRAPMHNDPNGNPLLHRLPQAQYADLLGRMKRMPLESGQILYEARSKIEYSYFPTSGTLSAVVVLAAGNMIEVATIGREGGV